MAASNPISRCSGPGCSRWSRRYAAGSSWLCGPRGCWIKVDRHDRVLLRWLWRLMFSIWPKGSDWGSLSPEAQARYRKARRVERKLWNRTLERLVLKEAGL